MTPGKYNKRNSMPMSCKCNHMQPDWGNYSTISHDGMSTNYNLNNYKLKSI